MATKEEIKVATKLSYDNDHKRYTETLVYLASNVTKAEIFYKIAEVALKEAKDKLKKYDFEQWKKEQYIGPNYSVTNSMGRY